MTAYECNGERIDVKKNNRGYKNTLKMGKETPIIMKWREDTNEDKQDPREYTARIRKDIPRKTRKIVPKQK